MPPEGTVYRVEQPMNDQHAMVLRSVDGRETVHAVEYANPRVRDRLASLSPGDTVRLRVTRVGVRAAAWRVERLYPGTGTRVTPGDPGDGTPVSPTDAV